MLTLTQYLVREHVGMLKIKDAYDIIDPKDGTKIGEAKEEVPGWVVALRFLLNKQMLPTSVNITDAKTGKLVVRLNRGFTLFRAKVFIAGADGTRMGYFRSKFLSFGGGFNVFDMKDEKFAEVKGDWKGWNFRFLDKDGQEIGTVTKKWAGLGKELFTSADNYMIAVKDFGAQQAAYNTLLLAAGIAIDTIYKEQ